MLRNRAVDFVEICNICARKVIIKAAKRIINSDKMCRSYSDLNFGITFFGTQCILFLLSVAPPCSGPLVFTQFTVPCSSPQYIHTIIVRWVQAGMPSKFSQFVDLTFYCYTDVLYTSLTIIMTSVKMGEQLTAIFCPSPYLHGLWTMLTTMKITQSSLL